MAPAAINYLIDFTHCCFGRLTYFLNAQFFLLKFKSLNNNLFGQTFKSAKSFVVVANDLGDLAFAMAFTLNALVCELDRNGFARESRASV